MLTPNQYVIINPDTTVTISSGNITNLVADSTIQIDPAYVTELDFSNPPPPDPFRYLWPQDYYVNLGVPCGESCCKVERSYCWDDSLNDGNGGVDVTETVIYGVEYFDCTIRDIPENWCDNWIEDQYGPNVDWSKFHSEITNCEEV